MDGFLLIDKPAGWTSFDVVAKTRGVIRRQTGLKKPKVGHAGTLDPMATGLLILLVGSYCKQAQHWLNKPKSYEATTQLGATSTTDDLEGDITPYDSTQPDNTTIHNICQSFVGTYQQLPPAYSAKKVDGVRAYRLARAGKQVQLEPKPVTIHSLDVINYDYPELTIVTEVSSGTYIRALARDIGETLKTGAYLTALRRTQIGRFTIDDAISIDEAAESTDLTPYLRQDAIDKT
jgi:tRNA pseudouridine55 synthase